MAINYYRSRDGHVIEASAGSGVDAMISASPTWTRIDVEDITETDEGELDSIDNSIEESIEDVVEESKPVKASAKKEVPVPLANLLDVEARLGRPLSPTETTRSNGLLAEASAVVRAYLGGTPDLVDDYDAAETVAIVVSRMVARCLVRDDAQTNFAGIDSTSTQFGPFGESVTFSKSPNDVVLLAGDKALLKPYRQSGFTAISLARR